MKLSVFGTGYVGLVTGACFASKGNDVMCIDNNESKINMLNSGRVPIYEPGLEELVRENYNARRLKFSTRVEDGVNHSDIYFMCVGTPAEEIPLDTDKYLHRANLGYIAKVASEIASNLNKQNTIIVDKSTVPAGTGEKVQETVRRYLKNKSIEFSVVSNPEFLREGKAMEDTFEPDRVVIGGYDKNAIEKISNLYSFVPKEKIIKTDLWSAEISKLASNAYLAMAISFANIMARLCDKTKANYKDVEKIMKMDKRIGEHAFLSAGLGFGGSCFPKDIQALYSIFVEKNVDGSLLRDILRINETQVGYFTERIRDEVYAIHDKKFCVLGLAFKPETDDIRESRSLELIYKLTKMGAEEINVYDPKAMDKAKEELIRKLGNIKNIKFCNSAEEAYRDRDILILATEWEEFKNINLRELRKSMTSDNLNKPSWIFEGRHIFNPKEALNEGFLFYSIGSPINNLIL